MIFSGVNELLNQLTFFFLKDALMSNEFAIQGNVHKLLKLLDVPPDSGQAAAFTEQLSKNVTPFVFTQVSAHNAKRKIAEFSPRPEKFLSKYEELKVS